MSEDTQGTIVNGKEPLNLMRQWILAKQQLTHTGQEALPVIHDASLDDERDNSLPKIVISRSSVNSTASGRPKPLKKTWLNLDTDRTNDSSHVHVSDLHPQSAGTGGCASSSPRFWRSNTKRGSVSTPSTPKENMFMLNEQLKASKSTTKFRFALNKNLPLQNDTPATYNSCSGSELDSPTICGGCGQNKFYGSRNLVGFTRSTSTAPVTNTPPVSKYQNSLNIRRTRSCRLPSQDVLHSSQQMVKASSNIDVQGNLSSGNSKHIQRTGSKDSKRRSISLTPSLSINLKTFKLVKNPDAHSDLNLYDRKWSLNDNSLHRVNEPRESSALRLLCMDKEKAEYYSNTAQTDGDKILNHSPKVTRVANYTASSKYGAELVDDFKSTFESDSSSVIPSEYGQVKIMFQFYSQKNELQVTMLRAANVARGKNGNLGVYAKVCLMPGKLQKKVCGDKHDTHDPVFNELFCFRFTLGELLDKQLRIKLYNKPGIFCVSEPIGECTVPLFPFDLTAVTVMWKDLKKSKGQQDDFDEFDFELIEKGRPPRPSRFSALLCGFHRRPSNDRASVG